MADTIERQQQARVVAQAQKKLAANQQLTVREITALRKWEREQAERYGSQYIAAMPKKAYAALSGRQPKQLIEAQQRYGLPYPSSGKTVDVRHVLRWFHDFLAANASALVTGDSADDRLLQTASQSLKDEYVRHRIEEKKIDIAQKAMDHAQAKGLLLPIEPIREFHTGLAERLKKLRKKFGRRFEGQDREFCERSFDDFISDLERLIDDEFDDDRDDATNG